MAKKKRKPQGGGGGGGGASGKPPGSGGGGAGGKRASGGKSARGGGGGGKSGRGGGGGGGGARAKGGAAPTPLEPSQLALPAGEAPALALPAGPAPALALPAGAAPARALPAGAKAPRQLPASTSSAPSSASSPSSAPSSGHAAARSSGSRTLPAPARSSASRTLPAADPAEPAPGFALVISSAKLALARFVFFVILSLDAVLQIPHAARYGVDGFNVAHLPGLLGPDRGTYLVLQCGIACLAMLVAVGTGGRAVAVALTLAYGWGYFGSQLDSYQHHYLVWLLLFLWCFAPQPPPPGEPPPARISSSALRLVVIQLGILYLWAALSKMEPKWLDGTAMSMQIHGWVRELIDATVGIKIGSRLIIVSELALAVTIWRVRSWRWAWPIGMGMHGTIALTGLEIGLFSYMMMALYLLILPEPYASRLLDAVVARVPAGWKQSARSGNRRLAAALVITAALLFIALRPPLQGWVVALFVAAPVLLTIGWSWAPRLATRSALAAALALLGFATVDALAHVTTDYYRYWGGAARRLGHPAEAESAYRGLLEVAPELELGHYYLGRLLVRRGALEEGLEHLRSAEVLEPTRTRALDEMASALTAAGRADEARVVAARAQQRRDVLLGPPGSIAPAPPAKGGGSATAAPASGSKNDETDENVEVGVENEPEQ